MKNDLLNLTRDTLKWLSVERKEATAPPPPSPPQKVKKVERPLEVEVKPKPLPQSPLPSEKKGEPMHNLIAKHLPHIRLKNEIPSMRRAAIVYASEEDLPFLENLARAIRERFCPVDLLQEGEGLDRCNFVIAQTGCKLQADIWLAPIPSYQENRELKRELWTSICQKLSPRYS